MLMAYASVAAFFLVAIGFMLGSLLLGKLIRPNNPYAEKLETYECGEAPVGPGVVQLQPALLHHRAHLHRLRRRDRVRLPGRRGVPRWVDQGQRASSRSSRCFLFVAILMLGLVYVWVKGDLEWIRSIKGDPRGVQNVSSRTRPRVAAPDAEPRRA